MNNIAIVILNWNGRQMLERYLPSVMKHSTDEVEVIVADNASTDDSLDFLKANYPSVGIIRFEENYGFAEGYNKALAQVKAEYYVLLNSDVEVSEHWLSPLFDFMENHPDAADRTHHHLPSHWKETKLSRGPHPS